MPYFIALATAGIPILEYSIGNRYRGAGPFSFRAMSRRWEWPGWWQAMFLIGAIGLWGT